MLYYSIFINISILNGMDEIRTLQAFLSTSKIRMEILKTLVIKGDMRQMELSKIIKEKQPNISNALYELEKKGLVICLTPEKRAWKVYGATDKGKESIKLLK